MCDVALKTGKVGRREPELHSHYSMPRQEPQVFKMVDIFARLYVCLPWFVVIVHAR